MKLLKIVLMISSVTIPELSVQLKALYVISQLWEKNRVSFLRAQFSCQYITMELHFNPILVITFLSHSK